MRRLGSSFRSCSLVALACAVVVISGCRRTEGGTQTPDSKRAGTLTFGRARLDVGTVVVRTDASVLRGRAKVKGLARKVDVRISSEHSVRSELLALERGAPTKLEVTYEHAQDSTWVRPVGLVEEPHVLDGNTYILAQSGGKLDIKGGSGGSVSLAEALELRGDFRSMHDAFDLSGSLQGQTFAFGETVPIDSLTQISSMGAVHDLEVTLVDLRSGRQGEVAVFALSMETQLDEGSFELEGELLVDVATGRVAGFKVDGPFELDVGFGRAKGTIMTRAGYTYSNEPTSGCRSPRRRACRRPSQRMAASR